ncbi:MAG: polysaccharide deacetylase family protein, partial [Nitrospinae bacterium]|nr:polysaccharide deacetylase family protein [Nitrospinota bacterium]
MTILKFTKYIRKYLRRHEKILIVILGEILRFSGIARLISHYNERIRIPGCYILVYHRVADERHESVSASVKNFSRQISFLNKYFSIITMERLINSIKNREPLPLNSIVITFDDGYKDVFTNAYPILKKYNIPATVFITTDYIEGSGVRGQGSRMKMDLPLAPCPLPLIMLSWEDILEMIDNNISIGSHSVSHPKLSLIVDDEVEIEVKKSKDIIQRHIKRDITCFSYPYGGRVFFNERIKEMLKRNGYQCACSTIYGINDLNSDLFELKRIPIEYYEDETIFMIKVFGLLNPLARFMD